MSWCLRRPSLSGPGMKRRNPETQKLRKMKKRSGISEGICSSSLIYIKLLVAWTLLLMADFLLGFRFEYLWPFWLLLRSIYDSFRYQGMAFSVFFVCMTVTSDLVCFLFIPVQWLFFLASTYVWVQYVWQAERGVCLPSVGLWLLFVYVEASVRLKELSSASRAFPITLDLCRPFAAHCIGYPVVTLGFGLKSYVGYKFRLRKQREVAKENKFYDRLLAEALPSEYQDPPVQVSEPAEEELLSLPNPNPLSQRPSSSPSTKNSHSTPSNGAANGGGPRGSQMTSLSWLSWRLKDWLWGWGLSLGSEEMDEEDDEDDDSECPPPSAPQPLPPKSRPAKNKQPKRPTSRVPRDSSAQPHPTNSQTKDSPGDNQYDGGGSVKVGGGTQPVGADELEMERLRGEVRSLRSLETELRSQLSQAWSLNSQIRSEMGAAKTRSEALEAKLSNLSRAREAERSAAQALERKLVEEQRQRRELEEREKLKAKVDKGKECSEACRLKRRELENDLRLVRRDLRLREDQLLSMDSDLRDLQLFKEKNLNSDLLQSSVDTLREKNLQLEKSLSAENKLKQDLFSALGEANRKLEIAQSELMRKSRQLSETIRMSGTRRMDEKGELELKALAATVAAATASPLLSYESSPSNTPSSLPPLSFTPPRSL